MCMPFKEHWHSEISVIYCSLFPDDFINQQLSSSVSADGGYSYRMKREGQRLIWESQK